MNTPSWPNSRGTLKGPPCVQGLLNLPRCELVFKAHLLDTLSRDVAIKSPPLEELPRDLGLPAFYITSLASFLTIVGARDLVRLR